MDSQLNERLAEFKQYIWTHTTDAFQASFDSASEITEESLRALTDCVSFIAAGATEEDLAARIRQDTQDIGVDHLAKVIQLTGLTRSKLTTDLDSILIAEGQQVRIPHWDRLPNAPQVWKTASLELAVRFRPIALQVGSSTVDQIRGIIKALNLATWPGYIRQERAKRGGHEAEGRLARVAHDLQISFEPAVKATNAMSGDIRIEGVSFDLVFPNEKQPNVVMKSTVHTANIGQYGESKDALEMSEARALVNRLPTKPVLLALADGLGFRSNRAGLEGVLSDATEFCQFRTLWKGIVIAASREGRKDIRFYIPPADRQFFSGFLDRYRFTSFVLERPPSQGVQAGDGIFTLL